SSTPPLCATLAKEQAPSRPDGRRECRAVDRLPPRVGEHPKGTLMYSKRLAATVAAGVLVMSGLATGTANASTGWVAKNPSRILNANTVRLVGGNTSVETTNLGIPVQAGAVVSFRYQLRGGAQCAGGAPRVFVETQ